MGLELLEITMDIEDRFGIELDDSTAYQLRTVGDFHRLIEEQLPLENRLVVTPPSATDDSGARKWTSEQIWSALQDIIHDVGAVPHDHITRDARLTEDLRIG